LASENLILQKFLFFCRQGSRLATNADQERALLAQQQMANRLPIHRIRGEVAQPPNRKVWTTLSREGIWTEAHWEGIRCQGLFQKNLANLPTQKDKMAERKGIEPPRQLSVRKMFPIVFFKKGMEKSE
jgi:hypothetical protein